MPKVWDCVIVGGGASGLAAAAFYAQKWGGDGVLLLEKGARVGKKLLATGNGTCNLSNLHATVSRYYGENAAFAAAALNAFSPQDAISFFERIGVACTVRENGRVYPRCEQAGAVLDCLRLTLDALSVTVRCDTAVTAITKTAGGLAVQTADETVLAKHVLLAVGGAAAPALGGSADGYRLAAGHRKTPLFASIVQVKTDTTFVKAMKGLRCDAAVTFALDGRILARETGEVLFTEYGLSGPAVMQISRVAGEWERQKRGNLVAVLDLLPDLDGTQVWDMLIARRALGRRVEDLLTGLLNKRIGQTVCRAAGLSLAETAKTLSDKQLRAVCDVIKGFSFAVLGTQGFGGAQVTAGGIATDEVDPLTMESKRVKGLYLLGEMLDIDGDCGGFNLQWAWASAHAAAMAAGGKR